MDAESAVDIEHVVLDLLQKQGKDYLTVKQLVKGLPSALRKQLALAASQPATVSLDKLRPHLGKRLQVYRGSRSSYIGRNLSLEELIARRIGQRPGVSSKQLGTQLPMAKKPYITALNNLLKTGAVVCSLRENHTPCLTLADTAAPLPQALPAELEDTRSAFKDAYNSAGQGGDFVRIHRLRDALGWPRERFDQVLMDLMGDYTVELHGGEPSLLTATERQDSFTDAHGTLYITLSWRGQP